MFHILVEERFDGCLRLRASPTLICVWHEEIGSPTRLIPLTDIIWSPIFKCPHLMNGKHLHTLLLMIRHSVSRQTICSLIQCLENSLVLPNEISRWTNLAAGPPGIMLAMTTVGNIEPHPLSTITTPKDSFFVFGTMTYDERERERENERDEELHVVVARTSFWHSFFENRSSSSLPISCWLRTSW